MGCGVGIGFERELGCLQVSGLGDVGTFTEMEGREGGVAAGGCLEFGTVSCEGLWNPHVELVV